MTYFLHFFTSDTIPGILAKLNWKLDCSIKLLHTMTYCQLCRFISAMEKLAELSSDKEQLEHLVERLQEETDTIGDYVIMYQHQRKQQRIKIQEKEQEVCSEFYFYWWLVSLT